MADLTPWGISVAQAVANAGAGKQVDRFTAHKFGKNDTCASGDTIMEPGGAYPYLTYTGTALAMRVKAGGHADDTSDGDGARTVRIQGLDENFEIAEETVTLAGASASAATTQTFSRVLRVYVDGAGDNRVNTGNIVIEDSAGVADYAAIQAGEGQGELGFITVPAGFRGYLTHIQISTSITGASARLELNGYQRGNANQTVAPFSAKRLFWSSPSLSREQGVQYINFEEPIIFEPYTDIWFEGVPTSGTPTVNIEFTMLFEKIAS